MLPSTSLAAHRSIAPTVASLRNEILAIIEKAGIYGCIMDDVFECFSEESRPGGTISSRFSELEKAGLIFRNGDTRPGGSGKQQQVMRSIDYRESDELPESTVKRRKNPFVAGYGHAMRIAMAADARFKESDAGKALIAELRRYHSRA